jgi:hypothetical protein
MAIANLALRFVVELVGVGALAYWGSQATDGPAALVLAVGAPLAMVVVWAIVVAPKARNPLTQPQRDLIGTGLLLGSAAALLAAGEATVAFAFAAIVVVNWILLVVHGPEARATMETVATGRRREAGQE